MDSQPRTDESLRFDTRVYRLNAIKKALYKLGNRCTGSISYESETEVVVHLKSNADAGEQLCADFRREVLDQDLREIVAEETAAIRAVLLAQAFSNTSLVDPVGETADYDADPLGIRDRN